MYRLQFDKLMLQFTQQKDDDEVDDEYKNSDETAEKKELQLNSI